MSAIPCVLENRRENPPPSVRAEGANRIRPSIWILRRAARDDLITRIAIKEIDVCGSRRERVSVIDEPGRVAMQTNRVLPVVVEVPGERLVANIAEVEVELVSPQPTILRTQLVDHEDAGLRRP
jgi:hypothetical protein